MKKTTLIICFGLLAILIMLVLRGISNPTRAGVNSTPEISERAAALANMKDFANAQRLKRHTGQSATPPLEQIYNPTEIHGEPAEIYRCRHAEGILGSKFIKTPEGQKLTLLLLENGYDVEYIWPVYSVLGHRDRSNRTNTFVQTPEQIVLARKVIEERAKGIVKFVDIGMPGIKPDVAEQIIAIKMDVGFGWPPTDLSKIGKWAPPAVLLTKQDLINYIYANPAEAK